MFRVLLLLVSCLLMSGCKRKIVHPAVTPGVPNTLVSGTFITGAGVWKYSEGNFSRSIEVSFSKAEVMWTEHTSHTLPGGRVDRHDTAPFMKLNAPGDPWFIYVETPEVLWGYNGSDSLRFEFSAPGKFVSRESIYAGKFMPAPEANIPPEIVPRLSPETQKLVPESSKRKRPSI